MSVANVLDSLKAERLLESSYILVRIEQLRSSLTGDDGGLSLDRDFDELEHQSARIPRLELLGRVAPNVESQYILQLTEALDLIQERITLVQNKLLRLQARLVGIQTVLGEIAGAFEAWYILGAAETLKGSATKLPVTTVKNLAQSEFNRLMGGLPIALMTLQVAVKTEIDHLANKKKMAREKVEIGREQVQAAWTQRLPPILGMSAEPGSLGLIHEPEEEPMTQPSKQIVIATSPHFIKTGAPALVEAISPEQAIVTFNDLNDEGMKKRETPEEDDPILAPTGPRTLPFIYPEDE